MKTPILGLAFGALVLAAMFRSRSMRASGAVPCARPGDGHACRELEDWLHRNVQKAKITFMQVHGARFHVHQPRVATVVEFEGLMPYVLVPHNDHVELFINPSPGQYESLNLYDWDNLRPLRDYIQIIGG